MALSSPPRVAALVLACACAATAACSGSSSDADVAPVQAGGDGDAATEAGPDYADPSAHFDPAAVKELEDSGVTKYLGRFTPSDQHGDGPVYYTFAPDKEGPICIDGSPFRLSVSVGSSDDLLIYLEGGGACWTGACNARPETYGVPLPIGWCDRHQGPLAGFNLVYVGFCDGSVFAGDSEVPDAVNGAPDGIRYHHGAQNLSAALDLAKKRFPNPRRIVLAGSSAGGYGTILGTVLARVQWPDRKLFVVNDAGLGLFNPSDPQTWATIEREWDLTPRIPASCPDCLKGELTQLIGWALEHDPTLRVAGFSFYEDAIISDGFLGMSGPDFRTLLMAQTGKVHDAYPDRFERFFVDGTTHTAIIGGYYDLKLDGVLLTDWTARMIDARSDWNDLLQ